MKSYKEILEARKPSKKDLDTWYLVQMTDGNNWEYPNLSKAMKVAKENGTVEEIEKKEFYEIKTSKGKTVQKLLQRKNFEKYKVPVPERDFGMGKQKLW